MCEVPTRARYLGVSMVGPDRPGLQHAPKLACYHECFDLGIFDGKSSIDRNPVGSMKNLFQAPC